MSTTVIGLGNALRGDDAAGLEVARLLGAREFEGEPVSLIPDWQGVERLVLVDAGRSGAPGGTIHVIAAHDEPLPDDLRRASTHLLGVGQAIEVARTLGRLPAETWVYVIEGECFDAGAPLSPAVAEAVPKVAEMIARA